MLAARRRARATHARVKTTRVATGALAALGALALAPAAGALPAPATFAFTGFEQTYVVAPGVTAIAVNAIGGAGAAGTSATASAGNGGAGGQVSGQLAVTPGETLFVEVGGNGGAGATTTYGVGGFNGGAGSSGFGGGGGGASDVRGSSCGGSCPGAVTSLESRLLVAAGGGGGGADATAGGNGGDAQSDGEDAPSTFGTAGSGGGGASAFGPGFGGPLRPGCLTTVPGAPGTLGSGGVGSNTIEGGGGDFAAPSASHVSFAVAPAGAGPSVTITPLAPAVQLSSAALSFGGQSLDTVAPPQTVTVTNPGTDTLAVTGLDATGPAAGDFLVGNSTCAGALSPGQACHFSVWFAPQGLGARTATLEVLSNDPSGPATITASGTGGQPPAGPQGPAGPTGPAGPRGPRGAAGTIVCQSTTLAKTLCAIEFAPGSYTVHAGSFTAQYQLLAHGHVAARGTLTARHGRITRVSTGRLRRGAYTLVVGTGAGRHRRVLLRIAVRVK